MSLPASWGWFGFSMIILSLVLFTAWALAQFFDWLFPGHGGMLLFACFVLLPLGIGLFAGSEAREAFFKRDDS